jgi:hypothetical protein
VCACGLSVPEATNLGTACCPSLGQVLAMSAMHGKPKQDKYKEGNKKASADTTRGVCVDTHRRANQELDGLCTSSSAGDSDRIYH